MTTWFRMNRIAPVWLQGLLLYMLCFSILGAIIFATPGFLGTDDYYHARISEQIIQQRRLALDFPWLPKTILDPERFVDHHLLYHLYVAPWMALAGVAGAKLATVSITAGVFVAVWALLRRWNTRWALVWALALFALSSPFLHRLLMIRTQGASLLVLILALYTLFQRRYRWLILVGFAYAWLYNGFVLLLGFAAAYTAAQWISDKRFEWQPIVYTAVGIALGLIINPYFPQNILFIGEHLGAKVDFENGVRVGNEWYPYNTGVLLANSGGALLLLTLGLLRPSFGEHRRDRIENTLLFVALITLFMVLRSRRFIEYFPAFALLFCAVAWGRQPLTHFVFAPGRLRLIVPVGALAVLLLFAGAMLKDVYQTVQKAEPPDYLAGAADWLRQNTPEGTFVFQTDWDDFTRLFYHNTHNTYLVGLDPTYLERADPALWDEWVDLTQGRVSSPSMLIQSAFGASYVVSDTRHQDFESQVRDDPNMQLVYRDQYSYVWRIATATAQTDS